ncbi:hypothetical protein [Myroides odoratus]|uniref:Uncharacterized protein n=1 Tax=Myroides odoratus TaxID=256 RepID=A0A378U576_MYROD|nr:hypothetical protein [Myroides odoratus]QQU02999.1 hypothetical protein I6I89_14430 [Myroides odoratus]STZ69764.1 Uncharacterised protein [Myroides odoratus]
MEVAVTYLENQLKEQDNLFELLVQQVERDFRMSVDEDLAFPVSTPLELVQQIQEVLEAIASRAPAKLSMLLYRIDVAEKDIRALEEGDVFNYFQQMTYLIVKREFQKVYFRTSLSKE